MKRSADKSAAASSPPSGGRSALDWPAQAGVAEQVLHELRAREMKRRRRRRAAGGIAGAALIIFSAVWWNGRVAEPAALLAPSSTAVVARPERQVLADGSVIELRAGAVVSVDYSEQFRRVVLEAGEAHFTVAKNPTRPFIVAAGKVDVRAVGTAFSVHRAASAVDVLVTEGRVAVMELFAQAPERETPVRLLEAGNRLVVDLGTPAPVAPPIERVSDEQASQLLAWRVPRLEFSGTPLAEAVPMFNQHSATQLELGDASLATLQLSGIIRADNVEALLRLLETNYGVRAERGGDGKIVLRAAGR